MKTKNQNLQVQNSDTNKSQTTKTKSYEYFRIGKAAKLIGVSTQTLRNWEKKGEFISKRDEIGGHRYYTLEQLKPYIEQKEIINFPKLPQYTPLSSVVLTSSDYNSEELLPIKTLGKILDAIIVNSIEKPALLVLLLGVLINAMIKLIMLIVSESSLVFISYQLQEECLHFQNY